MEGGAGRRGAGGLSPGDTPCVSQRAAGRHAAGPADGQRGVDHSGTAGLRVHRCRPACAARACSGDVRSGVVFEGSRRRCSLGADALTLRSDPPPGSTAPDRGSRMTRATLRPLAVLVAALVTLAAITV